MTDAALSCSFCGTAQRDVWMLIAGPTAHICDECVDICSAMVAKKAQEAETPGPGTSLPPQVAAACAICQTSVPLEASLLIRDRSRICTDCANDVVEQAATL